MTKISSCWQSKSSPGFAVSDIAPDEWLTWALCLTGTNVSVNSNVPNMLESNIKGFLVTSFSLLPTEI